MRWVVFNQKGGVGKSTVVCNLAAVSARRGRRTLVVDLDPQANATQYLLGRDAEEATPNLASFFEQTLGFRLFGADPKEFVHHTRFENLHVMASSPDLDPLQSKLESRYKMYKLRDALRELKGYGAVYLDTPPAFGFFTLSALIAADRCLIPFDCDDFSRRALYALMDTVREVQEDHNRDLRVAGIVVNQFLARAKLPQRLVDELRRDGLPVLEPFLSSSVKIRESHQASRPMPFFARSHKLSAQFERLYDAVENA